MAGDLGGFEEGGEGGGEAFGVAFGFVDTFGGVAFGGADFAKGFAFGFGDDFIVFAVGEVDGLLFFLLGLVDLAERGLDGFGWMDVLELDLQDDDPETVAFDECLEASEGIAFNVLSSNG